MATIAENVWGAEVQNLKGGQVEGCSEIWQNRSRILKSSEYKPEMAWKSWGAGDGGEKKNSEQFFQESCMDVRVGP